MQVSYGKPTKEMGEWLLPLPRDDGE